MSHLFTQREKENFRSTLARADVTLDLHLTPHPSFPSGGAPCRSSFSGTSKAVTKNYTLVRSFLYFLLSVEGKKMESVWAKSYHSSCARVLHIHSHKGVSCRAARREGGVLFECLCFCLGPFVVSEKVFLSRVGLTNSARLGIW